MGNFHLTVCNGEQFAVMELEATEQFTEVALRPRSTFKVCPGHG